MRSSATVEDLPDTSFAGQQDTYLNVHGAGAVQDAVRRCWASLWTTRAMIYRARRGIAPDEVSIAVVVQQLVPAEAAGVLFTADPQTGDPGRMVVNASWGLGESVVNGQVTPDTLVLDPSSGRVLEQHLGDKTVMTVRAPEGTREQPVPDELRAAPVLDAAQAGELAGIGTRIARLYGGPVDIEWALHDGHFAVVQARPITVVSRELEVWNDSRDGDFLSSNGNLGEAIPDVMTPCTWSLVQVFMARAMATASLPGLACAPTGGSVGGSTCTSALPSRSVPPSASARNACAPPSNRPSGCSAGGRGPGCATAPDPHRPGADAGRDRRHPPSPRGGGDAGRRSGAGAGPLRAVTPKDRRHRLGSGTRRPVDPPGRAAVTRRLPGHGGAAALRARPRHSPQAAGRAGSVSPTRTR